MDCTKLEWKKIRTCDVCDQIGFVRENIDNEGKNIMDTCFYGCGDSRNIPTPLNSVCDYCQENRGTEEVYSGEKRFWGFYCKRCKDELDLIIRESEEERIAEELEAAEYEKNYQELVEEGVLCERTNTELFFDIPEIYSSHAKYLKDKYEASKSGLFNQEGVLVITS